MCFTYTAGRAAMEDKIVIVNPSTEEAVAALNEAVSKRRVILMAARCRVNFAGRASTNLGPGDRILLGKPDGSLLVHRPWGYEPVNYQPDRSILSVRVTNGEIILSAQRNKPREFLEVICSRIFLVASMLMEDTVPFVHGSMEEDLYYYVKKELELSEKGLILHEPLLRPGGGIPDLTGRDSMGKMVIVEVKNETADISAVKQLHGYVRSSGGNQGSRGILVAPSIKTHALKLLKQLGLEFSRLNLRKYSVEQSSLRETQERLQSDSGSQGS